MNGLLLVFSILINVAGYSVLLKEFCKRHAKSDSDLHMFNAVSSLVAAAGFVVVALCSGGLKMPSLYSVLMGAAYGVITTISTLGKMKAIENGPVSYTTLIISCAMVIPSFAGIIFWKEPAKASQFVGIALMIISFCCAVDTRNEKKGMTLRWFLLSMLSALTYGATATMQKIHQTSSFKDELSGFLIVGFLAAAAFSYVVAMNCKRKGQQLSITMPANRKIFLLSALGMSVAIVVVSQVNTYLAGVMEAMVFYPVNNGGKIILTSVAGILLWRESFNRKQWVGMVAGVIAIILLCI